MASLPARVADDFEAPLPDEVPMGFEVRRGSLDASDDLAAMLKPYGSNPLAIATDQGLVGRDV